jgi:hypothetical protein
VKNAAPRDSIEKKPSVNSGEILMSLNSNIITSFSGVDFHHPGAFWFGAVSTTVGVTLHLPMYISARAMGYQLAGMPVDTPMVIGMFLIVIGFISSVYGLYPLSTAAVTRLGSQIRVSALDDAKITKTHVALLVVMAIAVTIDVMKPTTLAFVVPGMAQEYGLRSPLNPTGNVPVALVPLGAPSGVLLILLNRWIPESPRFLLANGREADARAVMNRYGAQIVSTHESLQIEDSLRGRWTQLFSKRLLSQTTVITILGIGIGLVLFGFNLWIPTNLRRLGFAEVTADQILRDSALIGFPFTFVVAWMYGFWSSKKTFLVLTTLTAAALFAFAVTGDALAGNRRILYLLLAIPIWGINSVTAVLSVYSSEIYPTRIRSHGSGLAAGASKPGGVGVLAAAITFIAFPHAEKQENVCSHWWIFRAYRRQWPKADGSRRERQMAAGLFRIYALPGHLPNDARRN